MSIRPSNAHTRTHADTLSTDLSDQLNLYLEEKMVGTTRKLATAVDEYVLTYQTFKAKRNYAGISSRPNGSREKSNKTPVERVQVKYSLQIKRE